MNEQAGAARWLEIHDDLLRGLSHTLSNRVATIDAAAYMLQYEGADLKAHAATLHGETERLDVLLQLLRTLPRNPGAVAEPMIAADAVDAALALVAHHNDMHDVAFDVDIGMDVMPLLIDPQALQHALLVAITSVARPAGDANADANAHVACTVRVHVGGTDDANGVRFFVQRENAANDQTAVADRAAIDWLLHLFSGATVDADHGIAFILPTLAAARGHRH